MRELGIDLSDRRPQRLSRELAEQADVVVTMGCGDACPYIPGKRYVDWEIPDPKGRPIDEVRATRDDIAGRVQALVAELDYSARSARAWLAPTAYASVRLRIARQPATVAGRAGMSPGNPAAEAEPERPKRSTDRPLGELSGLRHLSTRSRQATEIRSRRLTANGSPSFRTLSLRVAAPPTPSPHHGRPSRDPAVASRLDASGFARRALGSDRRGEHETLLASAWSNRDHRANDPPEPCLKVWLQHCREPATGVRESCARIAFAMPSSPAHYRSSRDCGC